MIHELKKEMEPLALREKTAKWQRQQYQQLAVSLPVRHSIVTLDFAENYLCKFQNEVQSAHWSYHQVSIHPRPPVPMQQGWMCSPCHRVCHLSLR